MKQFTEVFDKKVADEQNKKVSSGRSWRATELRLKSSEDLHKLWYVLLKEKNSLVSDNALKKKLHNARGPQGKYGKVKVSMARLLTVINERKKIREDYRKNLEDQYVEQQRKVYEDKFRNQQKKEVFVPEITHELMRKKYDDLRNGVDNTNYIQKEVERIQYNQNLRDQLDEKYDYKNKKIVDSNAKVSKDQENSVIRRFDSFFDKQMAEGTAKVSEQEVLRAHVKNWKMLNLKQRRMVINFVQARRARDAKKEFKKELNLLAQKIAHDDMQDRMTAKKPEI